MNKVKIGIISALVLLIVLSGIYYAMLKTNPDMPILPVIVKPSPTPVAVSSTAQTPLQVKLEVIMKTQLPVQNKDIDIAYSHLLKRLYVYKKTAAADVILNTFIQKNGLESFADQNGIVLVDRPAVLKMLEDEKSAFPDNPETKEVDTLHDAK